MAVWVSHRYRESLRSLMTFQGGDALGSASDQLYQPEGLVRQAISNGQPVIFIGINYRLGSMLYHTNQRFSEDAQMRIVFGFATSKALIAAKQAINGLRDQRAAFDCKCMIISDTVIYANNYSASRGSRKY